MLSTAKPRLITTFLLKKVPHGTNGGMSVLGTAASVAGGAFIGLVSALYDLVLAAGPRLPDWRHAAAVTALCALYGLVGSLLDSLLGATVQATFYSQEKKRIVKRPAGEARAASKDVVVVSGVDLLTNEGVNLVSIALLMLLSPLISPWLFSLLDSNYQH
jgi:uncharacterized membrane protein